MACKEFAAMRLSLMSVIGINDEAAKKHDPDELGEVSEGPLHRLSKCENLSEIVTNYEEAMTALEEKVAKMDQKDPKRPYYQTLLVANKKVEGELDRLMAQVKGFYTDLDEVHDYIHEIYPT